MAQKFCPPVKIPMFVTQRFGERPAYYKKYGLKGHNGLDIRCATGTKFYSMLPGVVHLLSQKTVINGKTVWTGYGAAWRLYYSLGNGMGQEWTFGHLQNRQMRYEGKNIASGVVIGETDNTGDSTGPHLHVGVKILKNGKVTNANNGFGGSVDPLPLMKKFGFKFLNA